MKIINVLGVTALAAALAACGGGDIEIDARNQSTVDNSVGDGSNNNTGGGNGGGNNGGAENPCASYTVDGETFQGTYATPNCIYGTDFASITKPYTGEEELVFSDLTADGAHIFNDSFIVGRSYSNDADLAAAGISEGGQGSVIRLEAGATLAFRSQDDYMVINRGSQIYAEGEANNPVTITSLSDVEGDVNFDDVQQWGGLVINGFGITNKCAYTGNMTDGVTTSDCHVVAEGKSGAAESFYGGDNNADSSGALRYLVVKHTGAQVATDNELNGISFNAVGSGTEVEYLQVYSTYDDGVEFFGGAVNIDYFVALYVRDDSLDIDEGYSGTINHALVIQSETDGNHCIESDGIGSYDAADGATNADLMTRGLNSQATIRNLTCIISPAMGTHDPGAGWLIREGHTPTIQNALVVTSHLADTTEDNYCVNISSAESVQAAENGDLVIEGSVFACRDLVAGDAVDGDTLAWLEAGNNAVMQTAEAGSDPTEAAEPNLVVLESFYSLLAADITVNGNDGGGVTPVGDSTFIGAVTRDNDWTAGWTYGLHADNRAEPLWFEAE